MPAETSTHSRRGPQSLKDWFYVGRFLAIHLLCFAAIFTGVPWEAVALCIGLWAFRMFAITAGYHRYFAHRTYKMGRVMQFIMAFLSQTSMQKGVLWWAAHHRHHHKHSDEPDDIHSPEQGGLLWSHVGWLLTPEYDEADMSKVKDLTRYPELRLLDRFPYVPGYIVALGCWLWMGWAGLIVGFVWSTVILWHTTFTINSLAHVYGTRRYDTDDESRNNWFLALLTFGEGWHNNHHHYQASTRQGFYWWEIDLTYYVLWAMSKVGLVSDLREPPQHVVEDRPHPEKGRRRSAQRTLNEFKDRVDLLHQHLQTARRRATNADFDDEIAEQIQQLSYDTERRLTQLNNSVDQVRRGAHEKLERIATDAIERVDDLARQMVDHVADLRRHATETGDQTSRALDQLTEDIAVQLEDTIVQKSA